MTPDQAMWLFSGFAFFIGLCIGSFLNVCIYRIPHDRSVVSPASACPSCGHAIRPWDNIPVVSWLLLRARCRDCGTGISSLYPAIELLTGLVAWLLFRRVFDDPLDLDAAHLLAWVLLLGLAAALIAQAYIDLRYQIIPYELSIYPAPLFILGWAGVGALGLEIVTWRQAVLGALFGGGLFATLAFVWRVLRRKDALGGGDVHLMLLIGAGLGLWPAVPYVLVVASLLGAFFGVLAMALRGGGLALRFPFGPALAVAAITYMVHGTLGAELYFERMDWVIESVLDPRELR